MRSGALIRFASVGAAAKAVIGIIRCNLTSLARCELLNADGINATNTIFKTSLEARTCAPRTRLPCLT